MPAVFLDYIFYPYPNPNPKHENRNPENKGQSIVQSRNHDLVASYRLNSTLRSPLYFQEKIIPVTYKQSMQ